MEKRSSTLTNLEKFRHCPRCHRQLKKLILNATKDSRHVLSSKANQEWCCARAPTSGVYCDAIPMPPRAVSSLHEYLATFLPPLFCPSKNVKCCFIKFLFLTMCLYHCSVAVWKTQKTVKFLNHAYSPVHYHRGLSSTYSSSI